MKVYRLIVRFDFPVNYEIIDSPGRVMCLLEDAYKHWNSVGENQQSRQIAASFERKGMYGRFTVQPTNIVLEIELADGIPLGRINQDEIVTKLVKLISLLFKEFEVKNIRRAGARVFCGAGHGSFEDSKSMIEKTFPSVTLSSITENFGEIGDMGLILDGMKDDLMFYKLKFGPYDKSEASRHFNHVADDIEKTESFNIILDLDVFERDFSILATPVHKWVSEALEYSANSIKSLVAVVSSS